MNKVNSIQQFKAFYAELSTLVGKVLEMNEGELLTSEVVAKFETRLSALERRRANTTALFGIRQMLPNLYELAKPESHDLGNVTDEGLRRRIDQTILLISTLQASIRLLDLNP